MPGTILEPTKLILCFDGTGNTFTGSNQDTNVVKLLGKLDRHHPKQYHYYQTGVGTYDVNETSVNKSWFGGMKSSMSKTIDQGLGTTFDAHVMAGYRFLMRYYSTGDKIYMFGFSRGAFTARFLARMVHTVGLLCKGNEEMVPFAYRLFQRYLKVRDYKGEQPTAATNPSHEMQPLLDNSKQDGEEYQKVRDEITAFCNTFCRQEPLDAKGTVEGNVKVFFLGIWDCVNSVAVLEGEPPHPVPVTGTAHFVRHAVAVDERRVKFKPALIVQDVRSSADSKEDIKEVWFPGNHGDVGGGWPAEKDHPLENNKQMTYWEYLKNLWTTRRGNGPTVKGSPGRFQLSDISLAWMIQQLELVGSEHSLAAVEWSENAVKGFKDEYKTHKEHAMKAYMHDTLSFSRGTGLFKVLFWMFLEWLPTITRWELDEHGSWERKRFPLNRGATRDIPEDAVFHESLKLRLRDVPSYNPQNNGGDKTKPCFTEKRGEDFVLIEKKADGYETDHQTYRLPRRSK